MPPKITVLMSVYNGEPYLKDSVESILSQSYKNFEFLIFNDNSTDGSLKLLENYASNDARIKIINNNINKGLGANLQQGITISSGEWIARMDADDIALPERLKKQIEFINNNQDVDIIGTWATDIDDKGKELGLRKMPLNDNDIKKYIWTCPIIHPSVMFRKSAITRIGSYGNEKRRQDYALWFRAANANLKFANIPEALIKYRYTNEYFQKNNFQALLAQVKIGWQGCQLIKAKPIAYLGVTVPLLKGVLPKPCKKFISIFIKKFDPRNKTN